MKPNTSHKSLYNLLKSIRDFDTSGKKDGQSYKVDESRLKKLKRELTQVAGQNGWKSFCRQFVGEMFVNEWMILEEEIDLNYVEVLEGETNLYIEKAVYWLEMVEVMGEQGLRGPDAMIVNLFSKSKLSLLVTSDSDFKDCFDGPLVHREDKAIFLLQ